MPYPNNPVSSEVTIGVVGTSSYGDGVLGQTSVDNQSGDIAGVIGQSVGTDQPDGSSGVLGITGPVEHVVASVDGEAGRRMSLMTRAAYLAQSPRRLQLPRATFVHAMPTGSAALKLAEVRPVAIRALDPEAARRTER